MEGGRFKDQKRRENPYLETSSDNAQTTRQFPNMGKTTDKDQQNHANLKIGKILQFKINP